VSAPPAGGAPGPHDGPALRRAFLRGIAWTAVSKWSTQVVSWASTIAVARLLTAADYGIVGMATVYFGLVQLVTEFGLSAAIVQRRDLDRLQLARLGGLAALTGLGCVAVSVALAGPIAAFFGEPGVRPVLIVLSLTFALAGLQVLPGALLARELEFQRLAWIDMVEILAQVACTLALALAGAGHWALVAGIVAGKAAGTATAHVLRPHPLAWPRELGALRSTLTFGRNIVASRLAWYVYSNADVVVIGRVLGRDALGVYTIASAIAAVPVEKITAVLLRVTAPVFAVVQRDREALGRYLRHTVEGLALVTVPAAVGLALVATDLVPVVLGERWGPATEPMRLLALAAVARTILPVLPQVLAAVDATHRQAQATAIGALTLPVAFWLGARWGVSGVAAVWLIGYPAVVGPLLVVAVLRRLGLRAAELARALWPATSGALLMAVAVTAVRAALTGSGSAARLAAAVAAGVLAYALVLCLLHGARVRAALQLWREARR
jgi:PST family polysaccharide transporter